MKPASLLLSDLLRAHGTFLMHHDTSLSTLFDRSKRSKFVAILSRYWDLFLSTWNVMLHGNPARDVYGGINIAASGELGVGVGEEERGSGEREVLEGLVDRVDGLVDLAVSKFGGDEDPDAEARGPTADERLPWLGSGQEPGPEDGAIFLGTGALSRRSLRDVVRWMEDLYTWGDHAYGVIESPTSLRRRARKTKQSGPTAVQKDQPRETVRPEAEPAQESRPTQAGPDNDLADKSADKSADKAQEPSGEEDEGALDKMVSYLKMGYGTYWSLPGGKPHSDASADPSSSETGDTSKKKPAPVPADSRATMGPRESSLDAAGHFLIGLKGDIEESPDDTATQNDDDEDDGDTSSRTMLRTINVELETAAGDESDAAATNDLQDPAGTHTQPQVTGDMVRGYSSHDPRKSSKLRVVVYVNRPFIFTFLFQQHTDSLAWDSLYRSLHYQLGPLKKPLLTSTSHLPERPSAGGSGSSSIHDLVWDPRLLTVHSTIPNIPETYEPEESWSRADALNTHLHLLNVYGAGLTGPTTLERTQKTSRGWWVVWTRLLAQPREEDPSASLSTIRESGPDSGAEEDEGDRDEEDARRAAAAVVDKEIFLIRRASDHVGFRRDAAEGAGRLAQGIGVDTRRYVEELLSLL